MKSAEKCGFFDPTSATDVSMILVKFLHFPLITNFFFLSFLNLATFHCTSGLSSPTSDPDTAPALKGGVSTTREVPWLLHV